MGSIFYSSRDSPAFEFPVTTIAEKIIAEKQL
jgi:hypothetical protein